MRHNVSILLGEDMKNFVSRLAKYIYKYGEGKAESFCQVKSWVKTGDGRVEIKKAELDTPNTKWFVSTTRDLYSTRLTDETTLDAANPELKLRHYFTKLHQQIVTINNGGDSSRLLLTLYLPLYDRELCKQVEDIVNTLNNIQSLYSVMVIGFCSDLRSVIRSTDADKETTPEEEVKFMATQKNSIERLAKLRLESNNLEQVIVLQNTNAAGFSLSLDKDSFIRIMGELSLLTVEKYDTVFTQAAEFDCSHPLCTLGLSVLNLDKYYFSNYLLRRSYLHILKREDVSAEKVDLNKVAIEANKLLQQHEKLFSNFYAKEIEPLVRQGMEHNAIVSQTSSKLQKELDDVTLHLTDFISKNNFTLPEKRALLAVILGYDDHLLSGYLFNQNQLTLDSIDEEVTNIFISANNKLVTTTTDNNGNKIIVKGPLRECCKSDGTVELPIKRLQQLRNDMRASTNYIREKSKQLNDIKKMSVDAAESEKRLTEEGFVIGDNVYHFDVEHQEVNFEENYQPQPILKRSVDLRAGFTPIKDQKQIGACTVFAVTSIFEYILKKILQKSYDLSESFVYYNVRRTKGNEGKDTGSSYQDVIKSIGTEGICTEILHPYSKGLSDEPSEEAYNDGKTRRIVKALNVCVKENDIKSAIQEGYPVAISLKVFNSFSTTTHSGEGNNIGASGFVTYPSKSEIESGEFGYHAMVIVGYTDETKHFVVRNSWGKDFGDKGYCYIPYSYICNNELNRMACIITEVDTSSMGTEVKTVTGDCSDETTEVHFNMDDAFIKQYVIQNLLDEEQRHLAKMQNRYMELRHDYEELLQEIGRQTKRNQILSLSQNKLEEKIAEAKAAQERINEVERPARLKDFDNQTFRNRITLIALNIAFLLSWIFGLVFHITKGDNNVGATIEGLANGLRSDWCIWSFVLLCIVLLITALFWWWVRDQRHRIENELEEVSANFANKAHQLNEELNVSHLKFHIAGMMIDSLLSLKTNLDHKYHAMKSYIGNLSQWEKEEKKASTLMEPLVKEPFIPLLNNQTLDKYFEENVNTITGQMHLYEYFNSYKLDDDTIIEYKRKLKENILKHISNQLSDFTVFRHVLNIKDFPYLDKEYASANNLLPLLDKKSEPFCQLRSNAATKPQARFLFIHTDVQVKHLWEQEYQKYFNTTPISEDIISVYKVLALRFQPLSPNEILMEEI